jgi:3',5'-cyclic AMP phosphodiesterase CpdA
VRIAHLSDLHLLSLEGAVPFRLLNKRLTGYVNLRLKRKAIHKPAPVRAAARALRDLSIDHVVITGDVTNLALEVEFALVRALLEEDLGLSPDDVSLVPGNHDVYTGGSFREKRFQRTFAAYTTSDLPELAAEGNAGAFPFVRLRGPVALIGLSTALPRPPLVASGALGRAQLQSLEAALEHPEVRRRTPILLQHHPLHNPASRMKTAMEGLADADALALALRSVKQGLLLHGHLHRRIHRTLATDAGHVDAIGATSASLLDPRDERIAGFNVYELDDVGAPPVVTSYAFVPETERFRELPIPRA